MYKWKHLVDPEWSLVLLGVRELFCIFWNLEEKKTYTLYWFILPG